MKFPQSIQVGYQIFKMEMWDHRDANAAARWGECDKMNAIIRVDAQLIDGTMNNPRKALNTTLHEILHACWDIGDLDREAEEEKAVTVLANQLTQVLIDNPELLKWLNAQVKRGSSVQG